MKVQVFILLGLMCYSAFSACDTSLSTNSITINGNSYKFGKDGTTTGCCLITGTTTTAVGAAGGACDPKGFFQIGTEVWIVMETAVAASDPLDVSATAYTEITPFANKGKNLAIGQLDLTAANLGKTLKGSYIGSLPSVGGTWADVAVGTGAAACTSVTTLLSIPITPTSFTVDQTAAPNTDLAIASSTYLGYDTYTQRFKGYSSDPCSLTFTSVATVTTNSVEYKVGTRGNECCVVAGTSMYCYNDVNLLGTCTALDIAADSTSNEVWVAIRVSAAAADVMTSSNGITGVDYSDSLLTSGTLIANSVLIGKITTTTGTDFGKFIYAAYVAPKTTAGAYTTFTFTDLRACTSNSVKYAQVEGTLGTSTWVDETGTAITAATGTGAFLVVTPATGNIEGFNSDGRVCAGASILSIASAILAFVGLVAL